MGPTVCVCTYILIPTTVELVYRLTSYGLAIWENPEIGYVFSGTNWYSIGSLWINYRVTV